MVSTKAVGSKDAVPRIQGKWTINPGITGIQLSPFTECVNILLIQKEAMWSHHADRVKKLRPAQGGLDSRIPVGFRNDLVDVERQKNKQGPLE
ncbi:hypothetical protein ACRRTK_001316 [Alexandromys fortis]